jgi:hypothetical protein
MAEPLRSGPVEHLSSFVSTTLSFVSQRKAPSWLQDGLPKTQSAAWRQDLQDEASTVSRLAARIGTLATVLVGTSQTNLTLAAVRIGTLINLQPLHFSDTHDRLFCKAPVHGCHEEAYEAEQGTSVRGHNGENLHRR